MNRAQDAGAQSADSLDAGQILVPFQLLTFLADRFLQLGYALVQAANLIDDPTL